MKFITFRYFLITLAMTLSQYKLLELKLVLLYLHHFTAEYQKLIKSRGKECFKTEVAKCSNLIRFKHSPRTPHVPCTNGLMEAQKTLANNLRKIL